MTAEIDKGYLGQVLLDRGFRDWFLYMFRVVEGTTFDLDPVHEQMLAEFQSLLDGKETRANSNCPPRTAKTTFAKYLVAYGITWNPRAHFIYTSYSQDLLGQIAQEIAGILQHPAYIAMYGGRQPQLTETICDPVDEFWKDYLFNQNKESKYTSHKITTAQGGVILFASIGSAITGFGAGRRNANQFGGMLIIDDGNKPADIRSPNMRKKVHTYYVDTLLTRLNHSNTPILNIQQRLHLEDLTGFLETVYEFTTWRHPLLDADNVCALPRQYTDDRVRELQKDTFTFAAQYQQMPVKEGGNLIQTAWMRRYSVPPHTFDFLFIVADTAFTEKKSADNSAFGLFGICGKDLYMLDGYCKKVIFPDLCRDMVGFYESACARNTTTPVSAVYIENKGSGISLIQQLRERGLPVRELMPTVHNAYLRKDQVTDKFTRFNEIAADLESGYFHIPDSAPWLLEFISECEAFTGGKQSAHDDFVDLLIYALKIRRQNQITDWAALRTSFIRR